MYVPHFPSLTQQQNLHAFVQSLARVRSVPSEGQLIIYYSPASAADAEASAPRRFLCCVTGKIRASEPPVVCRTEPFTSWRVFPRQLAPVDVIFPGWEGRSLTANADVCWMLVMMVKKEHSRTSSRSPCCPEMNRDFGFQLILHHACLWDFLFVKTSLEWMRCSWSG